MLKPNMPNMPNIPGIGAMNDTLEFVKNFWSSMGIPAMNMPGMSMPGMSMSGMVMPTLSVEEINKRITDLKAVESWLTLNMNMLRGTIQALEVQAATISTLQSMGQTFSATLNPAAQDVSSGQQEASFASSAASNGTQGASDGDKLSGAPEPTSRDEKDAANLTAPLMNAAAWWNMLQEQFKQAVSTAMADTPLAAAPSAAAPAEKPKSKPKATATATSDTAAARKRKTTKS